MVAANGHTNSDGDPALPSSILLYSHSWLPGQVDGVAVRMMAHAKSLAEQGVKVTVVTPDFVKPGSPPPAKPLQLSQIPGVEHVLVETQLTPVYRKNVCMYLSIRTLRTLVDVIKRVKPDLVHGTQESSMQTLATACALCDVPLVISMHTDVIQISNCDSGFAANLPGPLGAGYTRLSQVFVHWGYRNWAQSGGNYFCVSPQSEIMLRNAGVHQSRVCKGVWGPMVDRQAFCLDLPKDQVAELRRDLTFGIEGAFLMLYVGRVTAEKDPARQLHVGPVFS